VFRATVPKAAINKDCEPMFPKNKIRLAEQFSVATPASDVVLSKDLYELTFRHLITPATYSRHDL
jgi:hypothetical protein